jgi:hypothetical protein
MTSDCSRGVAVLEVFARRRLDPLAADEVPVLVRHLSIPILVNGSVTRVPNGHVDALPLLRDSRKGV